jgi:hypothetical protein
VVACACLQTLPSRIVPSGQFGPPQPDPNQAAESQKLSIANEIPWVRVGDFMCSDLDLART